MECSIHPMTQEDFAMLFPHLTSEFDSFWTPNVLKSELSNPNSSYFVAKEGEHIVGFAGIWNALGDIHITNIVVKKTKRHLGIGSKLLQTLLQTAKKQDANLITLEVNEHNQEAISLYEKNHFKKIGIRKNYYGENANAIIMTYYFKNI